MNANPRHSDGHDDDRAASGEPQAAHGAQGPTPRDIAGLLVAGPRLHSTNVVVPPVLHGLLKEAARRERTAISVVVVRALRAYLSQEYPDLHRRLMPMPGDWESPRPSAQAAPSPHEERPT